MRIAKFLRTPFFTEYLGWLLLKKLFWKILQNSQESTCVGVSFLIQLQAKHRCFSVSFGEFSRRASLQNTCEQLLFRFLELKLVFIEIYRNNRSEVLKNSFFKISVVAFNFTKTQTLPHVIYLGHLRNF